MKMFSSLISSLAPPRRRAARAPPPAPRRKQHRPAVNRSSYCKRVEQAGVRITGRRGRTAITSQTRTATPSSSIAPDRGPRPARRTPRGRSLPDRPQRRLLRSCRSSSTLPGLPAKGRGSPAMSPLEGSSRVRARESGVAGGVELDDREVRAQIEIAGHDLGIVSQRPVVRSAHLPRWQGADRGPRGPYRR